ncbi:hypothetical protein E2C01_062451 [Portunus trituberculatus]|uniref:Uncharacterized protein n=1 Tax=Portunus trituberculatus TaxID=210409 RepID=A0A5B7HB50_PORTR|nr:hypothetical protein [Portunus trituberculatus]
MDNALYRRRISCLCPVCLLVRRREYPWLLAVSVEAAGVSHPASRRKEKLVAAPRAAPWFVYKCVAARTDPPWHPPASRSVARGRREGREDGCKPLSVLRGTLETCVST